MSKAKHVQLHPYANVDINSWALRIRMIREALELSRPKFAELIDVPATSLKNYELGYREVSWTIIYALLSRERTRDLALAMFVDLPALTTCPDLNSIGEVQYTIPQITGVSSYSPLGVMRLIAVRVAAAMPHTPMETSYINRWVNCFNH